MHGAFLEKFPDDTPHRRSGRPSNWGSIVNWSGIVINFSNHGFSVISEVRDAGTTRREYAGHVAGQVKRLLAADVQPQRTTVAGHSKGGAITLITAALLQNPDIKFIDMAGCGSDGLFARIFRRLTKTFGSRITGRLMSVYDADDRITGSQDRRILRRDQTRQRNRQSQRKGPLDRTRASALLSTSRRLDGPGCEIS